MNQVFENSSTTMTSYNDATADLDSELEKYPSPLAVDGVSTFALADEEPDTFSNDARHLQVSPLVRSYDISAHSRDFQLLQHWECVVDEVAEDSVWADIVDLTDKSQPDEVVELPLEEFAEADRPLLQKGSVFYWAIGYETSRGGQRSRRSEIRVRRMPNWRANSLKRLKAQAEKMQKQLDNAFDDNATAT